MIFDELQVQSTLQAFNRFLGQLKLRFDWFTFEILKEQTDETLSTIKKKDFFLMKNRSDQFMKYNPQP